MKWKQRVALTLATANVIFTFIVVLNVKLQDIQDQTDAHASKPGLTRCKIGMKIPKQFLDKNATNQDQVQMNGDMWPNNQLNTKQTTNFEDNQALQLAR